MSEENQTNQLLANIALYLIPVFVCGVLTLFFGMLAIKLTIIFTAVVAIFFLTAFLIASGVAFVYLGSVSDRIKKSADCKLR